MPRFYFDIREGPRFVPDPGGEDLADLEAAKCYAARLAVNLAMRTAFTYPW
jgi:hypothetical protein